MEERFELFTALITKISRSIKKIKNQEVEEYGLRSPHVSCLYYLYISDNMTATELVERCEEDKATISRAIDYLESNGYLVSDASVGKRYKTPLVLSERGREVGEKIAAKIARVLDEISVGLTEEERAAFYRSLTIISDSLESIVDRADRI
jgi:DNA-binding MarR family transcriptional regulator